MANAGAARLTDAQAREIGRALKGLAVSLDDAIDDEERRLFPDDSEGALLRRASELKFAGHRAAAIRPGGW